jgi:hypothetical protein
MPYTYGGSTGDDANWGGTNAIVADNRISFICGWWRPTTLTATRKLWGSGAVSGAEVDTTTSQIRLRSDHTTDGQWTTSACLTVNVWTFLAFLGAFETTGPAVAWVVWSGTVETPPAKLTVTSAVTPVGALAGTSANLTIGNSTAAGTVAFQGDIDWIYAAVSNEQPAGILNPLGMTANGAISADCEDYVYRRYVMPAWYGNVNQYLRPAPSNAFETRVINSTLLSVGARSYQGAAAWETSFPVDAWNATISANGSPRPRRGNSLSPQALRRRR